LQPAACPPLANGPRLYAVGAVSCAGREAVERNAALRLLQALHRELDGDANVLVAGGTPSVKKKESSAIIPRRR
jgi:hypothetical protein